MSLDQTRLSECCGCAACYSICPKKCITMVGNQGGFLYPEVDSAGCINCDLCNRVCPIDSVTAQNQNATAYAAQNPNERIRENSSSGGVFPALADYVFDHGGAVFGAAFDEEFNVHHMLIKSRDESDRLQGAKYVQSATGETYIQAKKLLEEGKLVLFSGTPCQIEGLLHFLCKKYDNLITQDLVCHGVPAPGIWAAYKSKYGELKNISFRNKKNGWRDYSLEINDKCIPHGRSAYMKAFIKGYTIRPSCYHCQYCRKYRNSDFTLGDLWGTDRIARDFDDNKGTSLVAVNTERGQEIFKSLNLRYQEIDLDEAIQYNPSYVTPTKQPVNRDGFMRDMECNNFNKVTAEYCGETGIKRLLYLLLK